MSSRRVKKREENVRAKQSEQPLAAGVEGWGRGCQQTQLWPLQGRKEKSSEFFSQFCSTTELTNLFSLRAEAAQEFHQLLAGDLLDSNDGRGGRFYNKKLEPRPKSCQSAVQSTPTAGRQDVEAAAALKV